ncbi:MAG: hypothetical protein MHMPM18_000577 [Marteilia pararefringens]
MITPPEVFLRLLGLEYFNASRIFKFASNISHKLNSDGTHSPTTLQETYMQRPEGLQNLSLVEFCKLHNYRKKSGRAGQATTATFKYTTRERPAIVSTPLKYTTPDQPDYERYLETWLMHYGVMRRGEAAGTDGDHLSSGQAEQPGRNQSLYNQLIMERYDGRDPECPTLPQIEKDHASDNLIALPGDAISSQQLEHQDTSQSGGELDQLLQTIPIELSTSSSQEDRPEAEESEDDEESIDIPDCFVFSDTSARAEKLFRELQAKPRRVSQSRQQPEEISTDDDFDYVAALNVSQKHAFDKCIDKECSELIIVGKPGTGKLNFKPYQHYCSNLVLFIYLLTIKYQDIHTRTHTRQLKPTN